MKKRLPAALAISLLFSFAAMSAAKAQAATAVLPAREHVTESIDSQSPILGGKFVLVTYYDDFKDATGREMNSSKRQAVLPAVNGKSIDTTPVLVQTISGKLATVLVPTTSLGESLKQMADSTNIVRILEVNDSSIDGTAYAAYTGFHFNLSSYQYDTPWNFDDAKMIDRINSKNSNSPFDDVLSDRWSAGAIYLLATDEIVAGVGNNKFSPNSPVTRAAFLRMVSGEAQRSGISLSKTEPLPSDVSNASWAKDDAAKVKAYIDSKEKGAFDLILNSSTHLNPNSPITRAEAAQVLSFFVGTDGSESAAWAFQDWNGGMEKERVANLIQNGILAGMSATQFDPKGGLTREQMAAIIARMNYVN